MESAQTVKGLEKTAEEKEAGQTERARPEQRGDQEAVTGGLRPGGSHHGADGVCRGSVGSLQGSRKARPKLAEDRPRAPGLGVSGDSRDHRTFKQWTG